MRLALPLRCLLLLLCLLGSAAPGSAVVTVDYGRQLLTLEQAPPVILFYSASAPVSVDPGFEVVVEGTNPASVPAEVAVRMDDPNSLGWDTRINRSYVVLSGAFTIRIDPRTTRTPAPSSVLLDPERITAVIVTSAQAGLTIGNIRVAPKGTDASDPIGQTVVLLQSPHLTTVRLPAAGLRFSSAAELVVEGESAYDDAASVTVRLDDGRSVDYASQIHAHRMVPKGAFEIRLVLNGLRTMAGQDFDETDIRQIIVYGDSGRPVTIGNVRVEPGFRLPEGAHGFDLGPSDGPVFPGFAAVAPTSPMLERWDGSAATLRPYGDPLLADGIGAIRRMTVPVEPGTWRVTLWTEDPGAWETLPWWLDRHVSVNGVPVIDETFTPTTWLQQRYLAGRPREAGPSDTAWTAFGGRRGGKAEVTVEAPAGTVTIALSGDRARSTYLAGVLLERPGVGAAEAVEAKRRQLFESTWRIAPVAPSAAPTLLTLRSSQPDVVTAPGTNAFVTFEARGPTADAKPGVTLTMPRGQGRTLTTVTRFGHWRPEQPNTAVTIMNLNPWHLRGDIENMTLRPDLPRPIVLQVRVPTGTPPGRYGGSLKIASNGQWATLPFSVTVLNVKLPPAKAPVGVYAWWPAHAGWWTSFQGQRNAYAQCDLRVFRDLGLTAVSPPVTVPDPAGLPSFTTENRLYAAEGFAGPNLIYEAARKLIEAKGMSYSAAALAVARADATLRTFQRKRSFWAIADEPGNVGGSAPDPVRLAQEIRKVDRNVLLAGQLNAPADARFLPYLNVAFVNGGYGVDAAAVAAIRAAKVDPWFYNLGEHRLAAGFYLWRSGASGFLQWHARGTTADPYDTTDGREADVQLLYPTVEKCPEVPDIHRHLVDLSEGILDQRWVLWLEQRAAASAPALELLNRIKASVPGVWIDARAKRDQAAAWRASIMALAAESP